MLKEEQIRSLGKNNQSVDAQKTKERVKSVWGSLDAQKRAEILELCGLTQFAIQRTYSTGAVSAKTVCAISQTLKINPYYLIGESDEKDYFTDEIVSDFLSNRNITVSKKTIKEKAPKKEKPVKAEKVKPVRAKKTAAENVIVLPAAFEAPLKEKPQAEPSKDYERDILGELGNLSGELFAKLPNAKKDKIEKISEEELLVLLNGLVMRAKINGDNGNLLKLVKYILVC